jgi:hypothetical protein
LCDKATVFRDRINRTACKVTEICYCELMAVCCDGLVFCVWNGVAWDCTVVTVLDIGYRVWVRL